MGEVAVLLKIMPVSPDVDMDAVAAGVKAAVPKGVTINNADVVPFAFGLKALKLGLIFDDSNGGLDEMIESFANVDGVQNVETESVSLI